METAKIDICLEKKTLEYIDQLVKNQTFVSRNHAVQEAINEKLTRIDRRRLEEECSKLDPEAERALAEEGLSSELDRWPQY